MTPAAGLLEPAVRTGPRAAGACARLGGAGLLAGAALLCLSAGCGDDRPRAEHAVTINGHTWRVELALSQEQRYQGLSGRDDLADDEGMLFIYPRPQSLSFCMRGCTVPLDIAFLDGDRRVVSMATMAVEPDLAGRASYESGRAAVYALEVRAGGLDRARVRVGSRAEFSPGVPPPAKAAPGP